MRRRISFHVGLGALVSTLASTGLSLATAATIPVTNTADSGAGSLRAAIASATNGDTIDATGISGMITLTSGELWISNSLTVLGPGPASLAINGNYPTTTNGVFVVWKSGTVSVSGLTITNGHRSLGGGIGCVQSTLTVSNCIIAGNSTDTAGGGLLIDGISGSANATIINSILTGNTAGAGGAIYNWGEQGFSTLTVVGSIISSNSASLGASIKNDGDPSGNAMAFITNSTISGNSGGDGGGLYNDGTGSTLNVVDSTLSSNSASKGGGIYQNDAFSAGTSLVRLINTTVSGNSSSGYGGGIANGFIGGGANTVILISSTFSSNSAPHGANLYNVSSSTNAIQIGNTILNTDGTGTNIVTFVGGITSLGYNLCSDDGSGFLTNATDQINTNPLLGPLQDNGGPVFTHALLAGSPAIDQGKNLSGDATDARGFPRTFDDPAIPNAAGGDGTDIGAFEAFELLITAVNRLGNDLQLSFTSLVGRNYELQSRSDLSSATWTPLPGSIPGNGSIAQATVTNAFSQPQQFYQVHQLP